MKLNIFGKITKVAIQRRKILYFLLVILVMFGVRTYNTMTKSIFPEMKLPYVSIETYLVGGSASEMEEMVTNPIETGIKDLKDIKTVTSSSASGYSVVIIQFNEGVDSEIKVQQVQAKVNNILSTLPKNVETPIVQEYDISKFPIIAVEINADMPYQQVKTIVDDIDNRLKSVSGVKSVDIQGLNKPYIKIEPKFDEMNKMGLSYNVIPELIREQQFNMPLGNREMNDINYYFESDHRLTSLQTVKDIPINLGQNQYIKLSDIADVSYDNEKKLAGSFRIENGEEKRIVSLFVYKDPVGDTVAINKKIKSMVAEYSENLINKDYYGIRTSMDASEYIQTSIKDVLNNALGGLLSVIAVLFLFINLRESILASLVIPVTMISALLMFKTFNLTINVMSIMGLIIALGMLVDNAIVVIEMIDENKKHQKSMGMRELIIKSTNAVAPAIFSSTVTTVGAFIPLAFLSGAEGALIKAIPIATALAMGASFIVSITVTPVFAYLFIRKIDKEPTLFKALIYSSFISILGAYAFSNNWKLTNISYIAGGLLFLASLVKFYLLLRRRPTKKNEFYKTVISSIMGSKYYQSIVILVMISLFIYSANLLTGGHIAMEAMPKVDNKYLTGQISLIKGATESDSMKVFDEISTFLLNRSDIEEYSADVGKDSISFAIQLKNKNERDLHSEVILTELTSYVSNLPDVKGNFVVDGEEATSAPLSINIYNEDGEQLFKDARKITELLETIPGTVSPRIDFDYSAPTVGISVDKHAASRLNVEFSTILMRIRELIADEKIMIMKLDGVNTDIYMKPGNTFNSLEELGNIKVINSLGVPVLLKDLIIFDEQRNMEVINHEGNKKILKVKANLAKGYTANSVLTELDQELVDSQLLAIDTTYSMGGDYKAMQESYSDLTQKFIIAALIVYFVLLIQFNGYLQPIAIILSVPFSIIGVAIGYYVGGLTFSTLSFLGIVSLVGISVNDAIVLIDYINTLRREKGYNRVEAIIEGCVARFKPIMATSLTTMAGVAPLAFYSEDYAQMAYALIFGLFGSTVLTLLVVPVVLNILEGLSDKIGVKKGDQDEELELV